MKGMSEFRLMSCGKIVQILSAGSAAHPNTANHVFVPQRHTPPPTNFQTAFLYMDVLFQRCTLPWMCFLQSTNQRLSTCPGTTHHQILILRTQLHTTAFKYLPCWSWGLFLQSQNNSFLSKLPFSLYCYELAIVTAVWFSSVTEPCSKTTWL